MAHVTVRTEKPCYACGASKITLTEYDSERYKIVATCAQCHRNRFKLEATENDRNFFDQQFRSELEYYTFCRFYDRLYSIDDREEEVEEEEDTTEEEKEPTAMSVKQQANVFLKENKRLLIMLGVILAFDHFFLDGALRKKFASTLEGMLERVTNVVSAALKG